jgi:hypothetical protein
MSPVDDEALTCVTLLGPDNNTPAQISPSSVSEMDNTSDENTRDIFISAASCLIP